MKEKEALRGLFDCTDLNQITKPNNILLPWSDEILNRLGTAKMFLKMDLKTGFHRTIVKPEDMKRRRLVQNMGIFSI